MYEILEKRLVAEKTEEIVVAAPAIAAHAAAGQFVILRNREEGERYPLTIADYDPERGTVTLVFLEVGKSTYELGQFETGDRVPDIVGPLGNPTEVRRGLHVVCIGGGVGIAAAHPVAKAFEAAGSRVTGIIGAKTADLLFYEDRMNAVCDRLIVTTDDGSRGQKGFVTNALADLIEREGPDGMDEVFAVGPSVMMRAVAEETRPRGIRTIVSLNPIMVDGTGMCGGCRVEVGGETKFACVDGPEFDAHQVDFDLLIARQQMYRNVESQAMQECQLEEQIDRAAADPNDTERDTCE
ncbi:MAG: sulfide/dihydroorotate dehydrogenase-like FAD/NAD-binding protein [Planctomycetota bacterium]